MKTLLKLGNITVGEVSVSDITIEQEYTAKEVVELAFNGKRLVKEIIKELPEVMDDLFVALNKINKIDEEADEKADVEANVKDIWEVTSIKHSVEKIDAMDEFDYDLTVINNKINKYANNIGNPYEIANDLSRLESVCAKEYIEGKIDVETYKAKSKKIDEMVEQFNEIVRSF